EDFFCLPLAIPAVDSRVLCVEVVAPLRHATVQYGVYVPCWTTVGDVLAAVAELAGQPGVPMCLAVVTGRRVRRILPAQSEVGEVSAGDALVAYVVADSCSAEGAAPPPRPTAPPPAQEEPDAEPSPPPAAPPPVAEAAPLP
ncbi:unnamed protein product, partial [Prorocentrum cordatum]